MIAPRLVRSRAVFAVIALAAAVLTMTAAVSAAQEWRVVEDKDWCDDDRGRKLCEVREITLPATDDPVDVSCVNGSIHIEGWDRDEVYIKARIQVRAKTEREARELLSEIEIETNGKIRAKGPGTRWFSSFWGKKWSVSYQLKVPTHSDLYAHTTNGSLRIAGVTGEIDFGSTNGSVKLYRIGGDVSGGTVNGGITAVLQGDSWSGGGLDLHTTNGGVTIEMPVGYSARLKAKTTNGGIRVDHPIRIESKSRRRLEGTIGDGGATLKVRTVNGGVKFRESDEA